MHRYWYYIGCYSDWPEIGWLQIVVSLSRLVLLVEMTVWVSNRQPVSVITALHLRTIQIVKLIVSHCFPGKFRMLDAEDIENAEEN